MLSTNLTLPGKAEEKAMISTKAATKPQIIFFIILFKLQVIIDLQKQQINNHKFTKK